MGIRVTCPNCGRSLNVKSFLAGKRGVCPDCQAKFDIPGESGERLEVEETAATSTAASPPPLETPRPLTATASPAPLPAAMAPIAQPIVATAAAGASLGDPVSEAPAAAWYVQAPGGGQFGPTSGEVLRQWLEQGTLGPDSLLWRA